MFTCSRLIVVGVLAAVAFAVNKDAAKCDCEDDVCIILPPDDSKAPCYQGSNADTDKCFKTDPLLVDDVTKSCGTCEKFGFSTYIRNDPLYKTMSLYERDEALGAEPKNLQCTPPGGSCVPFSTDCCGDPCPGGWQFVCP